MGIQAFPGLIKVLHSDYKDGDITKSILETLTVLCTVEHEVNILYILSSFLVDNVFVYYVLSP